MKKYGFTLIELLVVISVIAVLSTIGFANFQGTQGKTRDARRKDDLRKIAFALELYLQKNGTYIYTPTQACQAANSNLLYNNSDIASNTSGTIPTDPLSNARYCYFSMNNNGSYKLFAKLENCSDSEVINKNNCLSSTPDPYNFSVVSSDLQLAQVPTGSSVPNPTNNPNPSSTATPTSSPTSNPNPTATPCQNPQTWYQDADGDTFGDSKVSVVSCSQPAAYFVLNNTDCYDGNVNAHPGQQAFFPTNRGDGSFDYNCDKAQETEFGNATFVIYNVNCQNPYTYRTYSQNGNIYSCYNTSISNFYPYGSDWQTVPKICGTLLNNNNGNNNSVFVSTDASLQTTTLYIGTSEDGKGCFPDSQTVSYTTTCTNILNFNNSSELDYLTCR